MRRIHFNWPKSTETREKILQINQSSREDTATVSTGLTTGDTPIVAEVDVDTTPVIVTGSPTAAETTDPTATITEIKDITITRISVTTVLTDTKDRITMDTTENELLNKYLDLQLSPTLVKSVILEYKS